jgi:hypothetical protein
VISGSCQQGAGDSLVLFSSNFETEQTILTSPYDSGQQEMVLAYSPGMDNWPMDTGLAFIVSPQFPDPLGFTYYKRTGSILNGIYGLSGSFPAYCEAWAASLNGWNDSGKSNIDLVTPGLHGQAAARINFDSTGHTWLNCNFEKTDNLFCRFYIQFSREALEGIFIEKVWVLWPGKRGLFRLGLMVINGKPRFCFRFPTKTRRGKRKYKYLISRYWCLPDRKYCVEFHYRTGEKRKTGAALWVNGKKAKSSYGHRPFASELPDAIQIGSFSWARLNSGHIIVDDVVISRKRVGTIPDRPEIVFVPDKKKDVSSGPIIKLASPRRCRSFHYQLAAPGRSWFLNDYSSHEVKFKSREFKPVIMGVRNNYSIRLRIRNRSGNWSDWSQSPQFTVPGHVRAKVKKRNLALKMQLTNPGEKKVVRRIVPGKWYDLYLHAGAKKTFKKLSEITLALSHFSYSTSSDSRPGPGFDRRLYYYYVFGIDSKKIFFADTNAKMVEVSGRKIGYVDNSSSQYRVDIKNSYLRARIRVSEAAVTGIWSASMLPLDKKGRLYYTRKLPTLLSYVPEDTGGGLVWKIILSLLGILIIAGSVIAVVIIKIKRVLSGEKNKEPGFIISWMRALMDSFIIKIKLVKQQIKNRLTGPR